VALDSRRQRRPAAVACGRTIKEAFSSSMASAGHGLMHAEPVSRLSSAPGQRTEATHTRATLERESLFEPFASGPNQAAEPAKEKEANKLQLPNRVLVAPCRGTSSAGTGR
jgi:hypothetical protein